MNSVAAADPAIVTQGLSKSFPRRRNILEALRRPWRRPGRTTALQEVSLEIRRGEVFGLLGPNGAGKTTLLKILSCLILPDSGRAWVNGAHVDRQEMAVKRAIGYVTSDERSFYWRLTGAQNLAFFARLFHVPPGDIHRRVGDLLARMELTGKAHEPFSSYSSGMKQRLSIARALLHDPPILFLDEPTRSLDPVTALHIRQFVRQELAGRDGKTVLLATHNLHEAADLCPRMAILAGARLRRTGRLDEFRALFAADRRYQLVLDRMVDLSGVARVLPGSGNGGGEGTPVRLLVELMGSGEPDLSALVARLAQSRARVLELTREETSLEDLFQRLFKDAEDAEDAG